MAVAAGETVTLDNLIATAAGGNGFGGNDGLPAPDFRPPQSQVGSNGVLGNNPGM